MTARLLEVDSVTTLPSRFAAKIDTTADCWLWTGFVDKAGYGRIHDSGKHATVLYAHRLSYELYVGAIPIGLTIDHLCRVTCCVNPAHLEAVTMRENLLRGESPSAKAARRTHCLRGHPYDSRDDRGYRRCGTCVRASARRRYAARVGNVA